MCGPPAFYFLFFRKWGQKVWSARFWWVINKLEKPGGPLAIFMPYLADLLPFMVIFERMLWRQSHPPAYHHPVVCILDIITNKFTFFFFNSIKKIFCFFDSIKSFSTQKKNFFFFRLNKKIFRVKKKKNFFSFFRFDSIKKNFYIGEFYIFNWNWNMKQKI